MKFGYQKHSMKNRINKKGIILIVILWILVILTTIAVGFGHSMMVEYRISSHEIDKLKTMELAKAGIERGIAELTNDSTNLATLTSPWRVNGMSSYQNVSLGDGNYTLFFGDVAQDNQSQYGQAGYGMTDENSKLNINTATQRMLMALPNSTQELADCIMEWCASSTSSGKFPLGADNSYYNLLNPPYNCKYAPFDTIEELLLVKDMTPQILFGDDTNLNGIMPNNDPNGNLALGWYPYVTVYSYDWNQALDGSRRVNITSASARGMQSLIQHGLTSGDINNIVNYRQNGRRYTNLGTLLTVLGNNYQKFGMVSDYVTISGNTKLPGLVNFNTASDVVLGALPGMNPTLVQQVIAHRNGGPFNNLGDIAQVIGQSAFQQVSNYATVRSSQFTIQSVGHLNDKPAYTRLIAVVDRAVIPIRILYYQDVSSLGPGI